MKVSCMLIACLILWLFTLNTFFSVLTLWHSYPHSLPDIGSKETHYLLKNGHILLRKVQLKLNFQDEGHLYVNCFFLYSLSLCLKCLLSQFHSGGIPMHISILTAVQKRHISNWKTGHLLLKALLLMLKFHDEGQLYSNCLFYILTYANCYFYILVF